MGLKSAGMLVFRHQLDHIEFFLVHPGGPFFLKKNEGFWTIPKGLLLEQEEPLAAALREFKEETGVELSGELAEVIDIGTVTQKGGKTVYGFALAFDFDAASLVSNTFLLEWPPRSGKKVSFPEIDRGGWFTINEARKLINSAQAEFLDRLMEQLGPS
jgi:predicted NUDIX family NTP pyrophosphohydrolase